MSKNKPIGVFDSGVGGLTVLKALVDQLKLQTFIYVGDNLNCPYGQKSPEQLYEYSSRILRFLQKQGVEVVVLACNTTSSVVLNRLESEFKDLKIIGVIDSTVKQYQSLNITKPLILATNATINNGAYQLKIPGAKACSCPQWVPLIESGQYLLGMEHEIREVIDKYENQIDSVILGCTHYPIIQNEIQKLYPKLKLVSSSVGVVNDLRAYLQQTSGLATKKTCSSRIYTTGDLESFIQSSTSFFNYQGYDVEHIDIDAEGNGYEKSCGNVG